MPTNLLVLLVIIIIALALITGIALFVTNNRRRRDGGNRGSDSGDSRRASSLPGYYDDLDTGGGQYTTDGTARSRLLNTLARRGRRFQAARQRLTGQLRQARTVTTQGLRQGTSSFATGVRRGNRKGATGIFQAQDVDSLEIGEIGAETGQMAQEAGFEIPQNLAEYGTCVIEPATMRVPVGADVAARENFSPPSTRTMRAQNTMFTSAAADGGGGYGRFDFETDGGRAFTQRGLDVFDSTVIFGLGEPPQPDFELEPSPRPYFSVVTGLQEDSVAPLRAREQTAGGREFTTGNGNGMPRVVGAAGEFDGGPATPSPDAAPGVAAVPTRPAPKVQYEPYYDPTTSSMLAYFRRPKGVRRTLTGQLRRRPFSPFRRLFRQRNAGQFLIVALASVFIVFFIIFGLIFLGRQIDRAPLGDSAAVIGRIGLGRTYQNFDQSFTYARSLETAFVQRSGVPQADTRTTNLIVTSIDEARAELDRTKADMAIWGYYDPDTKLLNLTLLLRPNGPFDAGQVARREMQQRFYEPEVINFITPVPEADTEQPSQYSHLMKAIFSYYRGDYDVAVGELATLLRTTNSANRPALLIMRGNGLYLLGKYQEATSSYNDAMAALRPSNLPGDNSYEFVENNRAMTVYAQDANKFYNEVNGTLGRLASSLPNQPTIVANYTHVQIDKGGAANNPVRLSELRERLTSVVGANPRSQAAQYYLGQLYRLEGNWQLAENSLLQAQKLDPNYGPVYKELGLTYLGLYLDRRAKPIGNNDDPLKLLNQAEENFQRGLDTSSAERAELQAAINSERQEQRADLAQANEARSRRVLNEVNDLKFGLARVVLERGRLEGDVRGNVFDRVVRWAQGKKTSLEDAEQRFTDIINERGDTENGEGYFYLGETLTLLGETDRANQAYEQARAKNPSNVTYYETVAARLAKDNKLQDAVNLMNSYNSKNPGNNAGYLALARIYVENGRYREGLDAAARAIQINSRDPRAHLLAGQANIGLKDYRNAFNNLSTADRLLPNNPEVAFQSGLAYYQSGDSVQAARYFQQALNLSGGNYPRASYYLGVINQDTFKNDTEALRQLRAAVEKQDNSPEAWFRLGQFYSQHNQLDYAVDAYQKCLSYDPKNYSAFYNQALLYEIKGRNDAAEANYRKVIELQPGAVQAHYRLSQLLDKRGARDEAFREAQVAVQLNPASPEAQVSLGQIYQQQGNNQAALNAYNLALQNTQSLPEAFAGRAQVRYALNAYDDALKDINRAIEMRPEAGDYYFLQGQILAAKGQSNEASQSFRRAIDAKANTSAQVYLALGNVYTQQQRYKEAEDSYTKALQVDNNNVEARYQLAGMYYITGQLDKAVVQYEEVVKAEPKRALAWFYLGQAYIRLGRTDDAIRALQNSIANETNRIEAHYELGNAYRAKAMRVEALREYDEAIKLSNTFYPAYLQKGLVHEELGQTAQARDAFNVALKSPDTAIQREAQLGLQRIGR